MYRQRFWEMKKLSFFKGIKEEIQQKMNTIPLINSKKLGFHQKRRFFFMKKNGGKKTLWSK